MDERFVHLVTPHVLSMLQTSASLIGSTDAEDAVQEALLRAWRSLATLRNEHALQSWLLRITINVCRDWQRVELGNPAQKATSSLMDSADELPDTASVNEAGSVAHAQRIDLQRAMQYLQIDLQTIVRLRYFAGLNASEIGQALDMPASTVRTQLARALAQLRQVLEQPDSFNTNQEARVHE